MALSFSESLAAAKAAAASATTKTSDANEGIATMNISYDNEVATSDIAVESASETGLIAAYSGDDGDWMHSDKYLYYPDYSDDNISTIDSKKNIIINQNQINLTQESNSQYIPFEMDRYYDGFDLMNATLLIHFVNKNKDEDYANPINVTYNDEKIRFAWLTNSNATAVSGKLNFELQAIGVNSKGDTYKWISRPCDDLNVEESLAGNGVIVPSTDWMTSFITNVTEQVALAQSAAQEAQSAITEVSTYAESAANSATEAQNVVDTAKSELETSVEATVNEKVTSALSNYYTTEQVDELLANIDISDQLDEVKQQITETNTRIDNIDGLAAFNVEYDGSTMTFYNGKSVIKEIPINSDPSAEWVTAYDAKVESKISTALKPVQTELTNYKTTTNANLEAIHSEIDGLPETLQNDYYNKEATNALLADKADDTDIIAVETELSGIKASVESNKTNISTVSEKLVELETTVNGIDKSPKVTYDMTYDETYTLTLQEITGEGTDGEVRTAKAAFVIQGGSGGGTSTILKIEYITTTPIVATTNDTVEIKYNFSGTDSSGDIVTEGNATWSIDGVVVATNIATAGENTFDITQYLNVGTQKVKLSIIDDAGSLVTKTWTVQKIDVRLESSFNDSISYPLGEVEFQYTPYGSIPKTVHFILDGVEIGTVETTVSGIPMSYMLPEQEHGAHLLDVYITATINNNDIESNHISKDIMWIDPESDVPVISTVYQSFTMMQYDTTNIVYTVYDRLKETPTVVISTGVYDDDGNIEISIVSTQILTSKTTTYSFKPSKAGNHVIEITCGVTTKTLHATVEEISIDVTPVTAGLVFDFNPVGYSNDDDDRLWEDGSVSMSVSDNFDWVNGGYQFDANGDQYFCVKAGTFATINHKLFGDDAKVKGKDLKLIFKTTNISVPNTRFLHCVDNTTGYDFVGVEMFTQEAKVYCGVNDYLTLPYSEEDIIEFEFNITPRDSEIPMIMGYEDGVSTSPIAYDVSGANFTQNTPQPITIGSNDCDVHIYRLKAYNTALTTKGILNNFIADARSAEEMIKRYNRNQIYKNVDGAEILDPYTLAEKCPWLRVVILEAPWFTSDKEDKISNTTVTYMYKNGDPVLDNWVATNCIHNGQGTSSNDYGAAGRNLLLDLKKSGLTDDKGKEIKPTITLGDGSTTKKITLTRNSVKINRLNFKVNVASCEHANNALLQKRFDTYNPYKRAFVRGAGDTELGDEIEDLEDEVKDLKNEIEECEAQIETLDPVANATEIAELETQIEEANTKITSFETQISELEKLLPDAIAAEIAKIRDTMEFVNAVLFVRETDPDITTHREFADNDYHLYSIGNIGDSKKNDSTKLTDPDDPYECIVEILDIDKALSTFPGDEESLDILDNVEDFSGTGTYEFRYIYEDGTDEENAEAWNYCANKWREFYKFIVQSSDEDFKANLGDYMVVDSALYYYLFTLRYMMVDNRAKNTFFHYGKTDEVDESGNPIRKWDMSFNYDDDTGLGTNNYGKMAYRYGLEDFDVDDAGDEVFRGSQSTFFCRIRDIFADELCAMYNTLESQGCWNANSLINQFETWQDEFPEELWRLGIERIYIRTYNSSYINGAGETRFFNTMCHGRKKYSRRQFERSQEKYMSSKFQSTVAINDKATIRCTNPSGDLVVPVSYKLKLTPYAYMYLNCAFGATTGEAKPVQIRAVPNKEYEIPYDGKNLDILNVYSASLISSFGDLSSFYADTVDVGTAAKLKRLIIGNGTDGYNNPYLTSVALKTNPLLETLNIENVSNLTMSFDLSAMNNLKELYAHGSNIGSVTFADRGMIEIAELPAITSFSMKNLIYLTKLDIVSLDRLTSLVVENCHTIDLINILTKATHLNRVRVTDINWTLTDTTLLDRIYKMKGIDKNGYNADQSILTGKVHVPVMREKLLADYHTAWPDLEITYDTLVQQFSATFYNADGTVLDVQYIDKGTAPVDPLTRDNNPIAIPTLESTVSTDYSYVGWDSELIPAFENLEFTAVYSETTRQYTVRYLNKGTVKQETVADYGTTVFYKGDIPTYTSEESAYKYYLFAGWDQSGYVNGNKDINAVYDSCEYNAGYFDGKDISAMRPVEIYAMCKLGLEQNYVESKDTISFNMGNDYDYDDIESVALIESTVEFTGSNYIDTGIALFDEDRDFVLAIDFEFTATTLNTVIAQCYQTNGSNGFKLVYNTSPRIQWSTSYESCATGTNREIIVLRHVKGEMGLHVYMSNMNGDAVTYTSIDRAKSTITDATLVFGCLKADDGAYENHATGKVHWAKLWYTDLGDDTCRNLAAYIHEPITLEMCGFKRHYLSNNTSKRCSMTFMASHALYVSKPLHDEYSNSGGWGSTTLRTWLNNRFYVGIPLQMRQLIKQVIVNSSAGDQSTEILASDNYVYIPSILEVNAASTTEPYINETTGTIDYITSNEMRIRKTTAGTAVDWWTRSPNASTSSSSGNGYYWSIRTTGATYAYYSSPTTMGVVPMISI